MKSKFELEITTEDMNNELTPEDEGVSVKDCVEEVESSIHNTIPRLITNERVLKVINEIINEGGWIEDIDGWEFPKDYCKKFEIKVVKKK